MNLFIVENNIVRPGEHCLLVSPFKDIWERDKAKNKGQAMNEFRYIELVCSPKKSNVFAGYSEKERPAKVAKEVFEDEEWTPDDLVIEAILKYKELFTKASFSYSYLTSTRAGAEKMKEFFQTFDFNETNDRGVPLYKPRDITSALKDTSDVLQKLNELQKKVDEELFNDAKTKGKKEINPFEE